MKKWTTGLLLAATIAAAGLAVPAVAGSFKAGIEVNETASAAETGIPVYPGAKEAREAPRRQSRKHQDWDDSRRERSGSSDGANVNLQFGDYGLTVITTKLLTMDDASTVAAFYKRELGKFGKVHDCRDPKEREGDKSGDQDFPRAVFGKSGCKHMDIKSGATVYRAGNKSQQRYVAIDNDRRSDGTAIQLVYVEVRTPD